MSSVHNDLTIILSIFPILRKCTTISVHEQHMITKSVLPILHTIKTTVAHIGTI